MSGHAPIAALTLIMLVAGPPVAQAGKSELVRYRIRTGASVDLGWTGIAHAQPWSADQILAFGLTCPAEGDACVLGGGQAGIPFGAPVPLSAGSVPVCVASRLRTPVGGSLQPAKGCGEIDLKLTTTVYTGAAVDRPCPICEGDPKASDGQPEGRCSAGAHAGKPCDTHATSSLFGTTSNDCLPAGPGVGDLTLDLVLTTGTAERTATRSCVNARPGGSCPCTGQAQANQCQTGTCAASERCDDGPFDGMCDGHPYRGCLPGSGASECEKRAPGAGSCTVHPRRCFGDTIAATGSCDPTTPTFVGVLCAPATRAVAVNATAGLPGPVRLTLPLELIR